MRDILSIDIARHQKMEVGAMEIIIEKYHGLGNDYFVFDPNKNELKLTEKNVKLLCDKNFGMGSDGVLEGPIMTEEGIGVRIWNPDGSTAGAVDVVIGSEEHVKDFVTQGAAENLSEVLSEEIQETYQDHIVDDKLFDLTGSTKIGNPLHVTAEPVYLVILNIGERQEYAAKFLEYLMQ